MTISACGEYEGEVLVDSEGDYVGDFVKDGGASWAHGEAAALRQGEYPCGSWIDRNRWTAPYVDGSIGVCPCGISRGFEVPFSNFGSWVGSLPVGVFADFAPNTGPPGLETIPMMIVQGSGMGSFGFVYYPGTFDYWHPAQFSRWVAQGWAKNADPPVPGEGGEDIEGCTINVGFGYQTQSFSLIRAGTVLNDEWTFFQATFEIFLTVHDPPLNVWPVFVIRGTKLNYSETRKVKFPECDEPGPGKPYTFTKRAPRGSVAFKCLHVYPEGAEPITEAPTPITIRQTIGR